MCQGSFKVISRKLEGCLKFRDDSKHVSRKTKECFNEDQRVFLGRPKIVSRKTKECFKEDQRVFQGSFQVASREFQWYFKGTQRVSQGNVKGIEE